MRYPAALFVDWGARILAQEHGLVVVDKPAGCPTVPTASNLVESALSCVQVRALDLST
jgi:23S rRNA-/tRNA-specific pseudouridylate synthase